MLLGGIHYLLPVIRAAHEQGYYVITADYVPDNVAHKYSDEYVNVSITDKEAVLKVAREKEIDGIISFGVDPGVVAAAYVQEKMGLPSMGPYESVRILQNKDLFRQFLADNGFNVPKSFGFASAEEVRWKMEEIRTQLRWPIIVKPTDSAGSKGVTRVDDIADLDAAIEVAFEKSISGHIIIEEYLEKEGYSTDTDSFVLDGQFKFVSYNAQRFDEHAANPYAPSAYTWPSSHTAEQEAYLTAELQRLITLLGMGTSVYNIETRISHGKPYIMECTPRGGGNRLCEVLRYATGKDLITAQVRSAVGDTVDETAIIPDAEMYHGHWAEIILHADKEGQFEDIEIDEHMPMKVIERDLWVRKGDKVEPFHGANNAIGTLILQFETKETMEEALANQNRWLKIVVK